MKRKRMTPRQIILFALVWADENIEAYIDAITGVSDLEDSRTELRWKLKQLRAYRRRRFGGHTDPFADAKMVNVFDAAASTRRQFKP